MRLQIRAIMNSPVEDIFGFRTCCGMRVFDQNLEILITNGTQQVVCIPSYFDLKDALASERIETLMPHGEQRVAPGETIAFYCTMDENRWKKAKKMVFYDRDGNQYAVDIGAQCTRVDTRPFRDKKPKL
jgi:hypothetical protein